MQFFDSLLFQLGAGLFIALLAHHLTIGRDKRREFNEIAIPLRAKILDEAERPNPMRLAIDRHQADAIRVRLWWFVRRRFMERCEAYWHAHNQQDKSGIGESELGITPQAAPAFIFVPAK